MWCDIGTTIFQFTYTCTSGCTTDGYDGSTTCHEANTARSDNQIQLVFEVGTDRGAGARGDAEEGVECGQE
jgi:hypothetical protein